MRKISKTREMPIGEILKQDARKLSKKNAKKDLINFFQFQFRSCGILTKTKRSDCLVTMESIGLIIMENCLSHVYENYFHKKKKKRFDFNNYETEAINLFTKIFTRFRDNFSYPSNAVRRIDLKFNLNSKSIRFKPI